MNINYVNMCHIILSGSGISHGSIKCYLSAIRNMQIAQDMPDPRISTMPKLEGVIRGIKATEPSVAHYSGNFAEVAGHLGMWWVEFRSYHGMGSMLCGVQTRLYGQAIIYCVHNFNTVEVLALMSQQKSVLLCWVIVLRVFSVRRNHSPQTRGIRSGSSYEFGWRVDQQLVQPLHRKATSESIEDGQLCWAECRRPALPNY